MPTRYSIYSTAALDDVLSARLATQPAENVCGLRSRSQLISIIADRYAQMVRHAMPDLSLAEWLRLFDLLERSWANGITVTANGLADTIRDAAIIDEDGMRRVVPDGDALASMIAEMPFASKIAIIDAAERFLAIGVKPDDTPASEADPYAHWRAPVRRLVGLLRR